MSELSPSTPVRQQTSTADFRVGSHAPTLDTIVSMDIVANEIVSRTRDGERSALTSLTGFVFAMLGLPPHQDQGETAVRYFESVAEQFGKESWGQLFSLGTLSSGQSRNNCVYAIDGSNERDWRARIPDLPYSPIEYRIGKSKYDLVPYFVGQIVLPDVFSTQLGVASSRAVDHHPLVLTSFTRQEGRALAPIDFLGVTKPLSNIRWNSNIVNDLNRQDGLSAEEAAEPLAIAEKRIRETPGFVHHASLAIRE